MSRTDNGHEFQTKIHWHVGDIGIEHAYIKPGTPRLNGKVERSHSAHMGRASYEKLKQRMLR